MSRLTAVLGYAGAGLTVLGGVLVPFVLAPAFTRGVAGLGIRPDPVYSGGEVVRTVDHEAYRVQVHDVVRPLGVLSRGQPFVQVDFLPVTSLGGRVEEEVDLDGDDAPDVKILFDVPSDPAVELSVDIASKNPSFKPLSNVRKDSIDRLVARLDDRIVVRVPIEP